MRFYNCKDNEKILLFDNIATRFSQKSPNSASQPKMITKIWSAVPPRVGFFVIQYHHSLLAPAIICVIFIYNGIIISFGLVLG